MSNYAWYVLASCGFAAIATFPGHTYGWAFFLPHITEELALSPIDVSLLWAAALLISAPLLPFIGRLIDLHGARKSLAVAAVPFVATVALAGVLVTRHWTVLLLVFFCMRVTGPGAILNIAQSSLNRWFVRRRGLATTVFICFGMLQLALPSAVDATIAMLGWRPTYPTMAALIG